MFQTVGIAFTVGPGIGALLTIDAIGASPELIFLLAAGFSLFSLAYATKVMVEPPKHVAPTVSNPLILTLILMILTQSSPNPHPIHT